MARSNIVKTLERKYARCIGAQRANPSPSIKSDIAHITAVIRMFDPQWDKQAVKPIAPRTASRWHKRGHGIRAALVAFKAADRPLSATEIARATYVVLGREPPHNDVLRIVGTDLSYTLRIVLGDSLDVIEGRPRRYRLRKGCN